MSDGWQASSEVERDDRGGAVPAAGSLRRRGLGRLPAIGLVVLACGGLLLWSALDAADEPNARAEAEVDRPGPTGQAPRAGDPGPPPRSLVAAERHVADPGPDSLRALIASIGGIEALVVGEASGDFDLVRFDPIDQDRLIASVRSSYGRAQNQGTNELWLVEPDGLTRTLLAERTPHDFAHFNRDGTITLWVNDRSTESFAPRSAIVLDRNRRPTITTRPVFASRFTAIGGAVFALTGDGDYYSNDPGYQLLVAEGADRAVLDSGEPYAWIDNPLPELLVAYPADRDGGTAVWSTATLEPDPAHPLAGRSYRRVAISGDQRLAVGVTFDGTMEAIDLDRGHIVGTFGAIDPRGVDQPITLDHDGTIAVTVDRSGTVTLWWVGDDTPIATVDADAAQPRWVSSRYGALAASAVAASAERIARRSTGGPTTTTSWTIIDIGVDTWLTNACALAGRALTAEERSDLGLDGTTAACV